MGNGKRILIRMILTLCMLASVLGYSNSIQAKAKKTTYYFASYEVTQFKLKKNKLTIETDKNIVDKTGIFKKGNEQSKKYKMTFKVAKNCKWVEAEFNRYNGSNSSSKSTYKKVRERIQFDRSWYKESGYSTNVGLCSFVVKNKKIIRVEYFYS